MPTTKEAVLIVEQVEPGSMAEQAGIQPGDQLLTYHGQPLISPAMLLALEENTFGVHSVTLSVQRAGEPLQLAVAPGKMGLQTRLDLPDEVLVEYERGCEVLQTNECADAAQCLVQAAGRANETPVRVWLLTKAAEAWEKALDWQQAREAYESAWEGLQDGEDLAACSVIAMGLGRCHQRRSEWDEAIRWYERAEQTDGAAGRELWRARSLNNLGNVAWRRGDLQAAQDYHTRAMQIRERLAPDSLDVAASLNNLGIVATLQGDLQAAQEHYSRALSIQERLAPDSLDVAYSLDNLGLVARYRGDLSAAQDLHTRALRIKECLAPDSLDVAASLGNLGIVAWKYGDLEGAHDICTRASRIFERLAPDSLDVAYSLNGLGLVAHDRGDLSASQDYHTRALSIRERLAPNSLDVAYSLNNLGRVSWNRGDLSAAQDFYTRALRIKERLAPDSLDVASSLNNLGNVALQRGDMQAAQDYHTRALRIAERLAPDSLHVAASLNNLGAVAYQRGDLQAAQHYHTRALQIYERLVPTSLDCAEGLTKLGQTVLRRHSPGHALLLLQQAVHILEQQRSAITSADARALLLAQHTTKYAALIQGYLAVHRPADAFSTLERSRARSLLELLTERRLQFIAQAPPNLLQQQQELDRQRAHTYDQLVRLSATLQDQPQIDALHATLRDLERRQQQLTVQIRHASPHYASLQYPQPLDCKAAQHALDPGTLLLSYLVDEEQAFLFAVTRKILQVFTLPFGRAALQERVQSLRRALDVRLLEHDPDEAIRQGRQLYADLIAPAQSAVRRAKRLLLCLDGPLHTLPFGALVTHPAGRPRYLAAYRPLHSCVSVTIYAQTKEESVKRLALSVENRTKQRREEERQTTPLHTDATATTGLSSHLLQTARRLLALGDPLYATTGRAPALVRSEEAPQTTDRQEGEGMREETPSTLNAQRSTLNPELALLQTRGLSLAPLPHSREEVQSLGRLFGEEATVRLGAEATKTAVLAESAEAGILHFACHGWLDSKMPLSSGLVLSQPEALGEAAVEGDNGLLQAWEIFSKLTLNAELVVLSACRTGLGQEVRGEGLIGLTRAFQYAGARSLVVSLWEVNDASTSAFMQAFYSALKAGVSKDEALREGVRTLQADARWNHPYFWSAFVLIGDRN